MKKKVLALLLTAVFVCSMVGCGDSANDNTGNTQESETGESGDVNDDTTESGEKDMRTIVLETMNTQIDPALAAAQNEDEILEALLGTQWGTFAQVSVDGEEALFLDEEKGGMTAEEVSQKTIFVSINEEGYGMVQNDDLEYIAQGEPVITFVDGEYYSISIGDVGVFTVDGYVFISDGDYEYYMMKIEQ